MKSKPEPNEPPNEAIHELIRKVDEVYTELQMEIAILESYIERMKENPDMRLIKKLAGEIRAGTLFPKINEIFDLLKKIEKRSNRNNFTKARDPRNGRRIYADPHGSEGIASGFRLHPRPIFRAMNRGGVSHTPIRLPVYFGDRLSCEAQALEAAYYETGHLDPEEWNELIEGFIQAGDPSRAKKAGEIFTSLLKTQRS